MSRKYKDGRLVLISGASRSGKTEYTKRRVRALPCVFVFDIEDQWSKLQGFKRVTSLRALKDIVLAGQLVKVAYVPLNDVKAEFEAFCELVYHFAYFHADCAMVAEELAQVSGASKANGAWGKILRMGLKRGLSIFAIIQSWTEGDKTSLRNASEFVIFRMAIESERDYMNRRTDIGIDRLKALKPLEYLVYDTALFTATGSKVTFK